MINKRKVSVIGLGYVGLTTATAFGHLEKVIAFDKNEVRIEELKQGKDRNDEVSDQELKSALTYYTSNPDDLKMADFHIISVPTPLDPTNHPDLSMLLEATEIIANQLKKGDIIVYESTVYPGATNEECIPLLEKISGLICGIDFSVAYSPERINPADKEHTFYNVIKIVSATDKDTLAIVSEMYKSVVKAGVFAVSSIGVAEAVKVVENIIRDVNIAYMNEIAVILHTLGIETAEVIAGMKTKWNFIPFKPGLVGGHCIGVNAYYLMHKVNLEGIHADLIMEARRVNENIVKFIAEQTIKNLTRIGIIVNHARIAILGLTYKENCPDLRDSKVIDIIKELKAYNLDVVVHDPIANPAAVKKEYDIDLITWDELADMDVIILTVAHQFYIDLDITELQGKLKHPALVMDIKELLDPKDFLGTDITLWRL